MGLLVGFHIQGDAHPEPCLGTSPSFLQSHPAGPVANPRPLGSKREQNQTLEVLSVGLGLSLDCAFVPPAATSMGHVTEYAAAAIFGSSLRKKDRLSTPINAKFLRPQFSKGCMLGSGQGLDE